MAETQNHTFFILKAVLEPTLEALERQPPRPPSTCHTMPGNVAWPLGRGGLYAELSPYFLSSWFRFSAISFVRFGQSGDLWDLLRLAPALEPCPSLLKELAGQKINERCVIREATRPQGSRVPTWESHKWHQCASFSGFRFVSYF
jgi:hypothetical protein